MAEQEQIKKTHSSPETERYTDETVQDVGGTAARGAELKAEMDGLLDEIDEVLEVNAEEFVRQYVQKGGE